MTREANYCAELEARLCVLGIGLGTSLNWLKVPDALLLPDRSAMVRLVLVTELR